MYSDYFSIFFENTIEQYAIPSEIQVNIQREEIQQHQTSFYVDTTYVPSEIQRSTQSDDLEEEIQQCQISLDSIIQKGPVDTVIRSIVNFYAEKLRDSSRG